MTTQVPPTQDEISEINHEHREVVTASKGSLEHAVKCGQKLEAAKKKVAHGEWENWLTENCPEISARTARLYMRLGSNQWRLEKELDQNGNGVADLSIRGAAKSITKKQSPAEKARRKKGKPRSPVVKEKLQNLDVDGVFNLLVGTFDEDFLDTLEERLGEHLKTNNAPETDAPETDENGDLSIPETLRRDFSLAS
jgi:hypothetical protein